MNRIANVVIAAALILIAVNMTYVNCHSTTSNEQPAAQIEEKVVQVVGRVTLPFDSTGYTRTC